jgi:hypothetical protein
MLAAKHWPAGPGAGTGQPRNVLAIHGWTDSAASFDLLAPRQRLIWADPVLPLCRSGTFRSLSARPRGTKYNPDRARRTEGVGRGGNVRPTSGLAV